MNRAVGLGALLAVVVACAGCAAAGAADEGGSGHVAGAGAPSGAAGEAIADVGNGRPQVTHDGLMVRRRVVLAILPTPGAAVAAVRTELDRAAAARHTTVSGISPSVLDPADQERLSPELAVVLPSGATAADAESLVAAAGTGGAALADVQDHEVAQVLVHDLRFTVRASDPRALAAAIAREGILADALGGYSTSTAGGRLDVTYTGPLLSDDLVEQVRAGIARGEGVAPSSVAVLPRSTAGTGVVLADEPAPAPVVEEPAEAARHTAGHAPVTALAATTRVAGAPPPPGLWVIAALVAVGIAVAVRLGVSLVRSADEEHDNGWVAEPARPPGSGAIRS